MRFQPDPEKQIAAGGAAAASPAFPGHADQRPVDDAGRNADFDVPGRAVVAELKAMDSAVFRRFEIEFVLVLEVAAFLLPRAAARPALTAATLAFLAR